MAKNNINRIIIFNEESFLSKLISKFFIQKDFEVFIAEDENTFLANFNQKFNIFITSETNLSKINLNTLKNFNGIIILITNNEINFPLNNIKILKKPINLIDLETLIKTELEKLVYNSENYILKYIKEFFLPNKKILFTILDHENRTLAYLYLVDNSIVHVEFNDLIGEEAIAEILKIDKGLLSNFIDIESPIVTSSIPLDTIIKDLNNITKTESESGKNIEVKEVISNKLPQEVTTISNNPKIDLKYSIDNSEIKTNKIEAISEIANLSDQFNLTIKSKILIVDDDILSTKILSKFFREKGFETKTCHNVADGINEFNEQSFDFVITDINIPGMSGVSFLLWIKKNHPNTKVIMITGFASEKVKEFSAQHGALSFFEKPIDLNKIFDFVKDNLSNETSNSIKNFNLKEFLQILVISKEEKLIELTNPVFNLTGLLLIKSSNLLHASYGNLVGETAFYAILNEPNILFKEITDKKNIVSNINSKLETLLKNNSFELNPNISLENSLNSLEKITYEEPKKIESPILKNNSIIAEKTVSNNKSVKILVVDDDTSSIKILGRFLENKGHSVKTLDSAAKGEELLKKEFFDLVITDVNMPEINGLEFLLWIKQYFPDIKVIVMTAFNSEKIKAFSNQKGAFYYFEKPINLKELEKLVADIFSEKNNHKDLVLEDFLKIFSVTSGNRLISIKGISDDKSAYLYIKDGKFVHAELDTLIGLPALRKIFENKDGIFSELTWKHPKEITLNDDISLVLEKFYSSKAKSETVIENTSLVKKDFSALIEMIRQEKDFTKKFTIYELGVALEIVIGQTTKEKVLEIMRKYSSEVLKLEPSSQIMIYEDISLSILFDDNSIVTEMRFGRLYKGLTSKGIRVGDYLKKGFEVYGKPDIFTLKGAIWEKIALFSSDGKFVTSIRIR